MKKSKRSLPATVSPWIAAAALALGGIGPTWAGEPSPPDLKQLNRDYITLSSWSFLPNLLIKRCEAANPDHLTQVRLGATQWIMGQMDLYQQVERRREFLLKILVKAANKPASKIDADFKQALDQQMVQGFFTDFSPEESRDMCINLDKSLPKIMGSIGEDLAPTMQRVDKLARSLAAKTH